MTRQAKTIVAIAAGAAAVAVTVGVAVTVNVERDPPTNIAPAADPNDPVRRLAEQELEAERQAQENRRQAQEGLQRSAEQLKAEQPPDGVFGLAGGRAEYERKQEEKAQAARLAKARANGFDSWEAYQASLPAGTGPPATRP